MFRRAMLAVRLTMRSDGFTPRAFHWDGALVRVSAVEQVETYGAERRYRVRTRWGRFELILRTDTGRWFVRRGPSRLGRALWRWRSTPRYALPAWRRRTGNRPAVSSRLAAPESPGGSHADGFALV